VHDDRGDAADTVQEPRLQPRHRQELVARGRGGAQSGEGHGGGNQEAGEDKDQARDRVQRGGNGGDNDRPRDGEPCRGNIAGEQPIQRLDPIDHHRCEFRRMTRAGQLRAST